MAGIVFSIIMREVTFAGNYIGIAISINIHQ